MKQKVLMIVGLFLVVSFLLLGLSYLQSDIMNSVRSYVRGEGLWAKAQKDAVFHLQNYASKSDYQEYQKYLEALKVPLGDRRSRVTLQSDEPELTLLYKAFWPEIIIPLMLRVWCSFFCALNTFPT